MTVVSFFPYYNFTLVIVIIFNKKVVYPSSRVTIRILNKFVPLHEGLEDFQLGFNSNGLVKAYIRMDSFLMEKPCGFRQLNKIQQPKLEIN